MTLWTLCWLRRFHYLVGRRFVVLDVVLTGQHLLLGGDPPHAQVLALPALHGTEELPVGVLRLAHRVEGNGDGDRAVGNRPDGGAVGQPTRTEPASGASGPFQRVVAGHAQG